MTPTRIYFYLFILLGFGNTFTHAQNFINGDLNGVVTGLDALPTNWMSVPFDDPICMASEARFATPDLTDMNGPDVSFGQYGKAYSGTTFVTGLLARLSDGTFFNEGIMQTVSGFIPGSTYTINFQQAVSSQNNCFDPSGSWAVYVDESLAAIAPVSHREVTDPGSNINWTVRGITFTASSNTHTLKFLPADDDTNLSLGNGCLRMAIDSIYVRDQSQCPPVVYTVTDTAICQEDQLVVPFKPNTTYLWQDLSDSPFYTVMQAGTYWVQMFSNGCNRPAIDTFHVMLNPCEIKLIIPNLITPNADQQNDVFVPIEIKGILSCHTSIVNRWGETVYSTNNLFIEWDASTVEDGIYYWTVECIDRKQRPLTQKGWVQVLR